MTNYPGSWRLRALGCSQETMDAVDRWAGSFGRRVLDSGGVYDLVCALLCRSWREWRGSCGGSDPEGLEFIEAMDAAVAVLEPRCAPLPIEGLPHFEACVAACHILNLWSLKEGRTWQLLLEAPPMMGSVLYQYDVSHDGGEPRTVRARTRQEAAEVYARALCEDGLQAEVNGALVVVTGPAATSATFRVEVVLSVRARMVP
jgi:hypothetical protein